MVYKKKKMYRKKTSKKSKSKSKTMRRTGISKSFAKKVKKVMINNSEIKWQMNTGASANYILTTMTAAQNCIEIVKWDLVAVPAQGVAATERIGNVV